MMKNLESRFESFHTLIESNRDSKSPRSLRSDSDNWSVSSGSSSTTAVLYKYAERMESVIRDPSNTIFTSATPQTPLSELDTYFNSRLPENSFPTLPTPLQVATKTHRLSSGFPYPWLLERYQISAHDWLLFTQSIISRWSLTTVDEAIANAAALGTAMVPGGILVSLPVRKAVLKARSNYKIRKGLRGKGSSEEGEEGVESTGELQGVLDRWNSDFFGPRGLVVDVRLPGKGGVNSEEGEGGCMVDKDGFCKEVEERLKAADAEAAAAKEKDGQMIVKKVNGEEDEEEEEEEYYLWDKWEKFSLMVKDTYAQELVRSDERDFNSNCRIVLSPVS
ncbi:hypothetical protein EDC01DRAFT_516651 [Geopyxis carbonaria]|nr:hypothetical protein EDC01DRAFT_516651 [Geopyxis carbonaria]